jgi:antitoxin YefM
MKTLSLSEAKMKLSKLVDSVKKTTNEVIITKNGKPAAVLISSEEYESLKETKNILTNQELMTEIKKGLKAIKDKKTKLFTLEELFS